MPHIPVNHPARPVYRVLAGLTSTYILLFGIAGLVRTWGEPFFDRGDHIVLGLRTNPAFSLLSIAAALLLLFAAFYGRNLDHYLYLFGSGVFYLSGFVMMALLRTDLNLLNFAMRNCIVSYVIGTVFLLAGLYGKLGSRDFQESEDRFRHGEVERREYEIAARDNAAGDRRRRPER
jgi:hypothetical protein